MYEMMWLKVGEGQHVEAAKAKVSKQTRFT